MLSNLIKIKQALQTRAEELVKARERGSKVVGYLCSYMPEEIIHALGLIPLRLEYGGDEYLLEIGGRYISKNNCVFIRELAGLFCEGKDPFVRNSDILAVAIPCLQMYRLSEVINYFFKIPTMVLGVPRGFYLSTGKEYFRNEVENFGRQLENFAGKKIDYASLKESVLLYDRIRKTLLEIYRLQAKESSPVTWRDVFESIQAGFYLDKKYYLFLIESLLEEIRSALERPQLESQEVRDERPRVLLCGSIIPRGDRKLINLIEQVGLRIVADDLCTGLRFISNIEVKGFSLDALAEAYISKIPCASLPYPLPLETDQRLANIAHLIEEYKVEGIIYHTLRFCDPFTFKALETKNFFKDKVAFIEIHTEYAPSDIESIRTRVEAFKELIYDLRLKKRVLIK